MRLISGMFPLGFLMLEEVDWSVRVLLRVEGLLGKVGVHPGVQGLGDHFSGMRWKILKKGMVMGPIRGFCNWSAMKGTLIRSLLQYIRTLESELANGYILFSCPGPHV